MELCRHADLCGVELYTNPHGARNIMVSVSPQCIGKCLLWGQKIKNLLVFYVGDVGVGTQGDKLVKILFSNISTSI